MQDQYWWCSMRHCCMTENCKCKLRVYDIKRRKRESRTYFLDKMRERLKLRMQRDDEKERER